MEKQSTIKKPGFSNAHLTRLIILFLGVLILSGVSNNWMIISGPVVSNMLRQMPEFGVISLGIMLTRISGRIDLSVVGTANLSSAVATFFMRSFIGEGAGAGRTVLGIFLAFVIALCIGALCGAFNGFLIYRLEMPAFIATIGTGSFYTGIGMILTKGTTVSGVPEAYQKLITKTFGPIPLTMIVYVISAAVMAFLLYKTSFGLQLYLSGTSMKASEFAGINSREIIFKPYIIAGCMSVLGGMIMVGRFNSVNMVNGSSYALLGVLICMIGGINPSGGQGRVEGVVLGTMLIQLITTTLAQYRQINSYYNKLVIGALMILFMIFNYYMDIRQEKRLNKNIN
ncbi:ABC transporter permease [Oscillospiraceae bacterium MB08-C2-2]|nr:ABC transporter permease [Oscillospiraceae bacterium MB08-C2-2]